MENQNELYPKMFTWLFIGLLITFVSGYVLSMSPELTMKIMITGVVPIVIVELVIAFAMGFGIRKMQPITAKICYIIYSAVTGITFSTLFIYYQLNSLLSIFLISAIIFAVLALYGYKTKQDLSKFGTILFISLIAIIIISLLNTFIFKSTLMETIMCAAGILIFCGYIAYDMNKVKYLLPEFGEEKAAVYGAFQLYLDFINLFIRLLELFGKKKD